jgi:NAD(P)-dependent dehydrogenase (short-subunit alcohol dehydrogenase family)
MAELKISFEGKIALVAGAGAGGIGSAVSNALAEAGATVVAVDRTQALVDETVAAVRRIGRETIGIVCDLREPTQVSTIVPRVSERFGRIDVLANIAGGTQPGQWKRFEETTDAIYRSVFALNLDYVFQLCRDCAALMLARHVPGSILNIASVSGLAAAPFHGPYGAAKAGVIALTQTMAIEWGAHGIRVNAIAPGAVTTPRVGAGADRYKTYAPLRRPVNPVEIASAALFLLSDLASGITGQCLNVDTGLSARSLLGGIDDMQSTVGISERP